MKKYAPLIILAFSACISHAQKSNDFKVSEVNRIESVLASDAMRGRKSGTPDIDKAASFINDEFKKAGLQPLKGNSFLQPFSMINAKLLSAKAELDDQDLDEKNFVVITTKPELKIDEKSGFELQYIKAGESFGTRARSFIRSGKNSIVFVDTSFAKNFSRLNGLRSGLFNMNNDVVFILGNFQPKEFKVKAEHSFVETKYANVVGVLPGNSRKNEYVIFSGHYDHLGCA